MEKFSFTNEDIAYCAHQLSSWKVLVNHLSNPNVTEAHIQKLIKYELMTKQRKDLLNRLLGRYFKLCRQREWKKLVDYIENKNKNEDTRIENRSILN